MVDVTASRDMDANAEAVFAVLADYWRRPALSPTNVTHYSIKRGGHGGGTLVRYQLHTAGGVRDCPMEVTEPIEGRELLQADTNAKLRTRWTVEPLATDRCRVHVETSWADAGGVGGWVERLLTPRSLRRTYNHTLDQLAHQGLT